MISLVGWMLYTGVCLGVALVADTEAEELGAGLIGRSLIALAAVVVAPVLIGMVLIVMLKNLSKIVAART